MSRLRLVQIALTAVIIAFTVTAVAYAIENYHGPTEAGADYTTEVEGVRVQTFDIRAGYCVVATHDTAQGAGVAMWCTN